MEKKIYVQYTGPLPDYLGRYIDECLDSASCSRVKLESFINFVNDFYPALQFTWEITETGVSMAIGSKLQCLKRPLTPIVTSCIRPLSQPCKEVHHFRPEDFQSICLEKKKIFVERAIPPHLLTLRHLRPATFSV